MIIIAGIALLYALPFIQKCIEQWYYRHEMYNILPAKIATALIPIGIILYGLVKYIFDNIETE